MYRTCSVLRVAMEEGNVTRSRRNFRPFSEAEAISSVWTPGNVRDNGSAR